MAHKEQQNFVEAVKNVFPDSFKNTRVLEIGSLNINGTIRVFFENCDYIGVDVGEGPGVDLVCNGEDLDHPDNSYDTVASTECFEHTPAWLEIFKNMTRMVKPGGLVFFTCASTGRPEHGTTRTKPEDSPLLNWDYYRNLTKEDFTSSMNLSDHFKLHEFIFNEESCDLYFFGLKKDEV
jgi:SAM-dependent methyltransferase